VRAVLARSRVRPELVFLALLVVGVALLPEGLPSGIAGLGVVTGSVLGLHAMGIVLLYSRTRILSFAQFGLGAMAATLFFVWVTYNQWAVLADALCRCLRPDVGAHDILYLQHNPDVFRAYLLENHAWVLVVNALISAAIGIVLAGDTGRRIYFAIAFLFARAPKIVPTIATLAFASMLGGAPVILAGRTSTFFDIHLFGWLPYGPQIGTGEDGFDALPEGTFSPPGYDAVTISMGGGATFRIYDILAVVAAIAAVGIIAWRFERGRRGLASRATATNAERAATLGVNVLKESKQPWQLAGALSAVAGMLSVGISGAAPELGLNFTNLTLVVAAVVIARSSSVGIALLASVALGIVRSGLFWNFGSILHFQGGLVFIIAVVLLLQRRRVSRAERDAESIFTTAPEPRPVERRIRNMPGVHGLLRGSMIITGLAFVAYPLISTPRQLSLGVGFLAFMVLGLSLLVLSGWGGQVSLGQLGIAAIGAAVVAWTADAGVPILVALFLGAGASAVFAPLIGFPALRIPGPLVAIMTLTVGLGVPAVLLNVQLLGSTLPERLPRPVLLGIDLASDRYYYWFCLLMLAGALLIVMGVRRSRLRRALIASRDNELAAASFGVSIIRLRLEAFAVSGFLAGLGGGLLAYAAQGVQPDSFSVYNSVALFMLVVVGGLSAVSGPIIGGIVYGAAMIFGGNWIGLFNGLGAVTILALRPAGLAGFLVGMRDAAIRVILHLQGNDLIRYQGRGADRRIAIAERAQQAVVVPVKYRMIGEGYGPVEGTRLRSVKGHEEFATLLAVENPASDAAPREAVPIDGVPVAAISCHRLDVAYGGAVALSGVTVSIAPGEILAVVGLNGAGKTSFLRALAGLERAAHGVVEYFGQNATNWFPFFRAMSGIAFVPGGSAVLPTMSVRDNLLVAGAADVDIAEVCRRFPALAERLDTDGGNLSGGEQQILAVAQGWVRRPKVLLIDELSMGLSPEALRTVLDLVQELADAGTAVVLVEQSISTAMEIADRALFLESGHVRYQGPAQSLRDHPELFASVAFGAASAAPEGGSEVARMSARLEVDKEPVLEVTSLSAAYGSIRVVNDVDLRMVPGEVVGILGPNGAGKTSLFDCLSGSLPLEAGSVTLLGEDITNLAMHERAKRGLMRSFQSVRLFPSLTVHDCIAVALETRLEVKSSVYSGLWLPSARAEERRVKERVDGLIELLGLEPSAHEPVSSLSLGQRRMVDLACQLAARPKVLLLDEPAAGLAQGETELLGPLIGRISSDLDCAVLIIEHNVQVLASVAHRLVAMQGGAVIAEGAPSSVLADPAVRAAYFGAQRQQEALVGSK